MIDFDSTFDRKIIFTSIHRFNSFLMKPLHSLVTAALLLTGCASDMTPKEKRVEAERKKIVNQVGDVTHSIGAQFGLSPLQRSVLASRAEKIA